MRTENFIRNINRDYFKYLHLMNGIIGAMDHNSRINSLKNEGKAKGRAIGREEGRIEANIEIAQKMKKAGWPLGEITHLTDLSADEVENI